MKKIVVLSGAGISAESGISTFRDAGGLWEGHDIMEVASPEGWYKNQALVLDFYNKRRRQLKEVLPNEAHRILAQMQDMADVHIITQNVDDLHERAGSRKVVHLHGELVKSRSTGPTATVYPCAGDIVPGDLCDDGFQLRPHIVWFGEQVPEMVRASELAAQADIFLIVGTSLQVYPAAGLFYDSPAHTDIYYIDPAPGYVPAGVRVLRQKASEGMRVVYEHLFG